MPKILNICLSTIIIFALLVIVDVASIKLRDKPIFAISSDMENGKVYKGLIYNTYVCNVQDSIMVVAKWDSNPCVNSADVLEDDDNGWYDGWYASDLNEVEGVSLNIREGTLTRARVTIIITDTNVDKNIFGEKYRIDTKVDERWKEVKRITSDNYGFNDMGYYVDENNRLEMTISWQQIYGTLEAGEYRIVKSVYDSEEKKELYFSREFTIDNN